MKRLVLLCAALLPGRYAVSADVTVVDRALASHVAYDHAVRLADEVGARMHGTAAADRGVAWAVRELKAMGIANVHTEPVTVTPWVRGTADRVELVTPFARPLRALALGRSPATPAGGITADVVEVASFEQLAALGDKVKGKIVFYDDVMQRVSSFKEYGRVGAMRFHGAIDAAKLGAVAAVIRSVGTSVHRQPHTGATMYDPAVTQIPFAALAAEDAMLLHRALQHGPARIRLVLGGGMRAPVQSSNVVAEVRGRDKPDEIVLVGAHLDSWDVGDGALDDGAGVGIAIQTLALAKELRPRRTVRLVLFMNEECGLDGAKAYAQAHAAELGRHVAATEADAGAGVPRELLVGSDDHGLKIAVELAKPLVAFFPDGIHASDEGGADLNPLRAAGVPTMDVSQDATDYFEWHHTDGDTADKIDPVAYGRAAAAVSALVIQLANSDELLPRVLPVPKKK